jgi:hypothetical protein
MSKITPEVLLSDIGAVNDLFLIEAESVNIASEETERRKKAAKYGAAGLALLFGAAATYWKFKSERIAENTQLEPQVHSG